MASVNEIVENQEQLGKTCSRADGGPHGMPCSEPAVVRVILSTTDQVKLQVLACQQHWAQLKMHESFAIDSWTSV